MKRIIFFILIALAFVLMPDPASADGKRWSKVISQDDTADPYESKWDANRDGDEASEDQLYQFWEFCNTHATASWWVDLTARYSGATLSDTPVAVAGGTRTRSTPILAQTCKTIDLKIPIKDISIDCDAGATCTGTVTAYEK